MKQYVFEVLEEVAKQRNRNDKVRILKENERYYSRHNGFKG